MQPLPPAPRRSTRLALVGASLFALLALVAFATRSGFGGRSVSAAPSVGLLSWLFSVGLVFVGVAILASIYVFMFMTGRGEPHKRKSFVNRVAQGLAFVALALVVTTFIVYTRRHSSGFRLPAAGLGKPSDNHGRVANGSPRSIGFEWPVLLVAVALPLVAWLLARRQRASPALRPAADADATLAAVVAGSISDAIDDLEAEPDARRAVIAAYARMESVLARHDLRRTPSETPLEYLRRVLLGLTARGDAVQALTGLFEEARFSRHEIDSSMKRDAIGALRTIRDDLQGAGA
jgi:Domain of unknown function (DUF4129)